MIYLAGLSLLILSFCKHDVSIYSHVLYSRKGNVYDINTFDKFEKGVGNIVLHSHIKVINVDLNSDCIQKL